MIRNKKFKIPIYGVSFTAILFETTEELKEHFKDIELHGLEHFDGVVFEHEDVQYLCLREYSESGKQYPTPGIIAHEAKHLVNQVFTSINCRLDAFNDEPECYLLGWVVDMLHAFINDK